MVKILAVSFPPSGPWFIGELIDGHSGVCFAFGVFIDGHFLEGSLTYVVGVVQVRKSTSQLCLYMSKTFCRNAFCVYICM